MSKCAMCQMPCSDGEYHAACLRRLSANLETMHTFPYSAQEQRRQSAQRAFKMSIQGVQPKLSAALDVKNGIFEIVDKNGTYIIKPAMEYYEQVPENEALTMNLAQSAGFDIPPHGLVRSQDGSFSYFVKRFDRRGRGRKVYMEDFAQLSGEKRDTKYGSSMEKVVKIVDTYCSFPVLEKEKMLRLVLFNFLVGNEDAHLKNFSLYENAGKLIVLSPGYDLLNTTIVMQGVREELALPLNGKKNSIKRDDLFVYLARERMSLTARAVEKAAGFMHDRVAEWKTQIDSSFLTEENKARYKDVLETRAVRLWG